ncbi:MAG: hypothetical protein V1867_05505 [Candidatus Falkowbacteria bacterium]
MVIPDSFRRPSRAREWGEAGFRLICLATPNPPAGGEGGLKASDGRRIARKNSNSGVNRSG